MGTRNSGGRSVLPNFHSQRGLNTASGDNRRMVRRFISSGILGLPQSRPCENDQSVVTISPTAPACRARSTRSAIASRPPSQYTWKNTLGFTAMTSSIGLLAKEDRPIAVPRAAAARATATSPSGSTACTPVGEISTGIEISCPITVVVSSRLAGAPTTCGAKPSSPNASTLSETVIPFSLAAIRAA
ncbi:hypothetical protein MOKP43_21710 [Mycobacterium avium subsp. hominissuis]